MRANAAEGATASAPPAPKADPLDPTETSAGTDAAADEHADDDEDAELDGDDAPEFSSATNSDGDNDEADAAANAPSDYDHGVAAGGPLRETARDASTGHVYERPSHSYSKLIALALESAPDGRLRLRDIYRFVRTRFRYYEFCRKNWKVRPGGVCAVGACLRVCECVGGSSVGLP
jgi:hypothetical protein